MKAIFDSHFKGKEKQVAHEPYKSTDRQMADFDYCRIIKRLILMTELWPSKNFYLNYLRLDIELFYNLNI